MDSTIWTAVSAIASAILGATSLFLLFQGQRDRRRIAEDRRAEQAKRITVSVEQLKEQQQEANSWSILGLRVVIRNDSDRPIFFGTMPTVALYVRPNWRSDEEGANLTADWQTEFMHLPQGRIDPGQGLELNSASTRVDAARLEFTDTEGNRWFRTSDDGKLFPAWPPATTHIVIFQALCRVKILNLFLMKWPHHYASWRFKHTTAGVPLTARYIRFWWGIAPIGEMDPWMVPSGAADDWPYELWATQARRRPAEMPAGAEPEATS